MPPEPLLEFLPCSLVAALVLGRVRVKVGPVPVLQELPPDQVVPRPARRRKRLPAKKEKAGIS